MRNFAFIDELTGLANRLRFRDELISALEREVRVAVLCLDLDRFDAVNAGLGVAYGDLLLQLVAKRIKQSVRECDTVARMGEDEYHILLCDVSPEEAKVTGQQILDALQQPFILDQQDIYIAASVGASYNDCEDCDREELLRNARLALRQAKYAGGNCYREYDCSMGSRVDRLAKELDLRRAIQHKELIVYYQPQFSLTTRELIGVEALVRWRHPTLGLVPPSEFIPLAEETGLILPLSEYVMLEACRQNKAWQDAGYGKFRVAVNITAKLLIKRNLVELVAQVLEQSGLEPQYLELEIPENTVMQLIEQATPLLNQLREMGVWIALDDFGTGYSSLSYLRTLPIDTLKIDRSFVKEMSVNPYDAAITAAAVALAKVRNLSVVAEGVESDDQEGFLRTLTCDSLQGFLYSRPLPPEEVEQKFFCAAS